MVTVNLFNVEFIGDRTITIQHRAGHRWFFHFQIEGFQGDVPQYAPTRYPNDEKPDDPLIDKQAEMVAAMEAQARGWLVTAL